MIKFKKIAALCMVAITGASVLAGCTAVKKTASDTVELNWYFIGDTSLSDNDEVYARAGELVYEKLGYKVNFKPIDYASYNDKIQMVIAGGENYDICWTSNWKNDYATNVANGAFVALDDLLQETPELRQNIADVIWDGTRIDGKIYGVPSQQIMARSACIRVPEVFYEKYGSTLKDVKSYADMDAYMAAYAKDYPDTGSVQICWQNLCYAYGVDEVIGTCLPGAVSLNGDADDIKVFNQFDTDEWRELIQIRKEWTDKGYTLKGTDGDAGGDRKLLPEEIPFAVETYKPGIEQSVANSLGYPIKTIRISDAYLTSAGINSTLNAISSGSKHPVEALKLLEYVNTDPEIYNLLVYGIEGKHYIKLDDNTVRRVENTGFKNDDWVIGSVYNGYLLEGQDPDTHQQTKDINDNAKTSKLLGFTPDVTPIKLQIANCTSVTKEYFGRIDNGLGDVQALNNEMLLKLENAGVNDIITELQRQIDEWLKTK